MSTIKVAKVESPDTSTGGIAIDSAGDVQVATNFEVATIKDTSGNNSSTPEEINQGRAKAWVNFNGTGTPAARDSYNISSITDNATGNYTLNFTNAMSSADFAFAVSVGNGNHTSSGRSLSFMSSTTTSLQILTEQAGGSSSGNNVDEAHVCVVVFGD